jgi:hypothetical protein
MSRPREAFDAVATGKNSQSKAPPPSPVTVEADREVGIPARIPPTRDDEAVRQMESRLDLVDRRVTAPKYIAELRENLAISVQWLGLSIERTTTKSHEQRRSRAGCLLHTYRA